MGVAVDRRRLTTCLLMPAVIGLSLIDVTLFGVAGRTNWGAAWSSPRSSLSTCRAALPMYTSLIVLMFGTALLLGSWLATIPAALIAQVSAIRS